MSSCLTAAFNQLVKAPTKWYYSERSEKTQTFYATALKISKWGALALLLAGNASYLFTSKPTNESPCSLEEYRKLRRICDKYSEERKQFAYDIVKGLFAMAALVEITKNS